MRILFLISTYNRSHYLEKLIKQIGNKCSHEYTIAIYDDYSDEEYRLRNLDLTNENMFIRYKCSNINNGKRGYWKVINEQFEVVYDDVEYDYYFMLPDDFVFTENGIDESMRQYEAIQDDKKICLSLILEQERIDSTNWVDRPSELKHFGNDTFYLTHWMDMCIVAKYDFFKALDFKMLEVSEKRWEESDVIGSGVGAQITKRLNDKYNLYHVSQSLMYEEEHESKMNPNRIQAYTPHTNLRKKGEKVYVGIATIPGREKMLQYTIDSLKYQADEICIMYNGFEGDIEEIRTDKNSAKIITYNSKTFGDYADAGKFCRLFFPDHEEYPKGYFFTCDDDIIYPGDYVYNMINHIERNNRKSVIGLHGVVLNDKIDNYYRDRDVISCLRHSSVNKFVHILGTGAMAFHTDTIPYIPFAMKLLRDYKNMADIHFGLYTQHNKIPMLCVKHDEGYLKYMNPETTIFNSHKNDCTLQTELVNSIQWKINTIEEQYKIKETV